MHAVSASVLKASVAASMTTAAAKDSMVRCKNIDERIKKFVKQANKNADPEAQEAAFWAEVVKMDPTRATNADPDDKVQQPGSASEEDNDQGEEQSDKCEGCDAPVKFCVCQMTAGTDKNGRKTKKTGHRRRYKSKTKRKTRNTPPPRAATLKGALAGASTGRVSGGEATDAPASNAASTAAAAANGVGSGKLLISFMVTLGPKQLMTVSTVLLAMSSAGLITGRVFLQVIDCTRLLFCHSRLFCHTQPL